MATVGEREDVWRCVEMFGVFGVCLEMFGDVWYFTEQYYIHEANLVETTATDRRDRPWGCLASCEVDT